MLRFLPTNPDLFEPVDISLVDPWRPRALSHEQWPPNYKAVYAWRMAQLKTFENPALLASAKAFYATRPAEFIMHWMDTFNPRKPRDKWMPFVFFSKQLEFAQFLHTLRNEGESGLVEKCRDAGATWEACAYSVWSWLFIANDAIGWGSRKQELVDKLGNPDSIFEKMRLIVRRLPACFRPVGLSPKDHMTFMRMINPENGSTINGEAGDNIGRGGRNAMYFKDESAHYERPELVEAALGENTNCQVDISSVNGLGNVFHRRRIEGVVWEPGKKIDKGFTRVFVIDWRDHPEKTQDWYDIKRAKAEREGMLHVFAQEVDRNYSAAVLNTIIDQEWLNASIDAHKVIGGIDEGPWSAGFDVAGSDSEGADANALSMRKGMVVMRSTEWGDRDAGQAARLVMAECKPYHRIRVQYDAIGVGETVKAEFNRLIEDGTLDRAAMEFVPWNAGGAVQEPYGNVIPDDDQSPLNRDMFANLKAQAWWSVRTRFYKTWRAIRFGVVYRPDELISLDGNMHGLQELISQLAQPTSGYSAGNLKLIVNKKPKGTRSPNRADALVMDCFPIDPNIGQAAEGNYRV